MIRIINDYCNGCSEKNTENCTSECIFNQLLAKINQSTENILAIPSSAGCHICIDKKGKSKEVFYDNPRGGLGIAEFCPNCGRKM